MKRWGLQIVQPTVVGVVAGVGVEAEVDREQQYHIAHDDRVACQGQKPLQGSK